MMNALVLFAIHLLSFEMILARPQQGQIEPAYLRDYYAQISQQNAHRGSVADATPIFEQNTSFQPSGGQLATVGQQIRVRDPVQDQVNIATFLLPSHLFIILNSVPVCVFGKRKKKKTNIKCS